MIFRGLLMAATLVLLPALGMAAEFRLAPYKDKLFSNPKPFRTLYGGGLEMIEYSVEKDLRQRDEIVEKKARPEYVSLEPVAREYDLTLRDGAVKTSLVAVGNVEGAAKIVVLFLHGRGAGRRAGFDDWTFGGNFNRIKNLMVRNGGVYAAPSFADFRETGRDQVKGVMKAFAEKSPGVPIFIACASAAGALCTALVEDPVARPLLAGVLFLGSGVHDIEADARAFADATPPVPLFIAHGSKDQIVNWVRLELFFKALRAASPNYPVRFQLFVPGQHGTPMRMTDWRKIINWMLSLRQAG